MPLRRDGEDGRTVQPKAGCHFSACLATRWLQNGSHDLETEARMTTWLHSLTLLDRTEGSS